MTPRTDRRLPAVTYRGRPHRPCAAAGAQAATLQRTAQTARAGQTLVAVEGTLAGTWAALAPLERRAVEALATVASGRGVAMVAEVVALAALVFAVAAAAATAGGRVAETDDEAGQQQVCLACPGLASPRPPRAARQPVVTVTVQVMWTACALKTRVSPPVPHTHVLSHPASPLASCHTSSQRLRLGLTHPARRHVRLRW
jgi:hypothetical protein